jgi:hypothetical protein
MGYDRYMYILAIFPASNKEWTRKKSTNDREGYNTEKAAAVINSGWAFDPVHPSKHVYAKMALNLLEKVAPQNMDGGQSGQRPTDNRKRSWSSSNQGGGGGGFSGPSRDGHTSSSSASTGGRQRRGRRPEASNGRREDAWTASGPLTPAAMPAVPTAAAPTTAGTVTGGQREVASAVVTTTVTGACLTAATAAAAAEAAEEEVTAAGFNPAPCRIRICVSIFFIQHPCTESKKYNWATYNFLSEFFFSSLITVISIQSLPMFTETWMNK